MFSPSIGCCHESLAHLHGCIQNRYFYKLPRTLTCHFQLKNPPASSFLRRKTPLRRNVEFSDTRHVLIRCILWNPTWQDTSKWRATPYPQLWSTAHLGAMNSWYKRWPTHVSKKNPLSLNIFKSIDAHYHLIDIHSYCPLMFSVWNRRWQAIRLHHSHMFAFIIEVRIRNNTVTYDNTDTSVRFCFRPWYGANWH